MKSLESNGLGRRESRMGRKFRESTTRLYIYGISVSSVRLSMPCASGAHSREVERNQDCADQMEILFRAALRAVEKPEMFQTARYSGKATQWRLSEHR